MRNNLKGLREDRSLTQQALAEAADVSVDVIYRLECGESIQLRHAEALCRALRIGLGDLLWLEEAE